MRAPVCQLYLSIMRKGQWEGGRLSLLSDYRAFSQFTRSVHSGEWPLPGHVLTSYLPLIPQRCVNRTNSATDCTLIFSITCARGTLTACSTVPRLPAFCWFSLPATRCSSTSSSP